MLGRRTFTRDEIDAGKGAVAEQLAAWRSLPGRPTGDAEATYFNGMLLALDRRYVHRVRSATGKDTNPLTEVELLAESIMSRAGTLRIGGVIKYDPHQSVLGYDAGSRVALTEEQFERLSVAFLVALEARLADWL
ncbi:MAG: hypothetical protein M3237_02425 [Actinomycetota bacterium]|nr:hypothetical protein [Actinomycetota bacterium]